MTGMTPKKSCFGRIRSALLTAAVWIVVKPLILFFGALSLRAMGRWAAVFYYLAWPFLHGMRKVAVANLKVVFPERDDGWRRRIAAASIRHVIRITLEGIHLMGHPEDHKRFLEIPPEVLEATAAMRPDDNTSLMVTTCHIGNWELFGHLECLTQRPGAVVTSTFTEPALNRLMVQSRTTGCDTLIIPARGAAIGMLKAIAAHRDIGVIMDQNVSVRKGGVMMPFFGLPAAFTTAPAAIAIRGKMPVRAYGCFRQEDGHYLTEMYPLETSEGGFADAKALTAAVLRAYEQMILRHPEQYLWGYRRWREIPDGATKELAAKYPYYAHR